MYIRRALHVVLLFHKNSNILATKQREHHTQFHYNILTRTERLFVFVTSAVALVVGRGQYHSKLYLRRVLFQFLDDGLPFRRKLIQDQRLKPPAAQHRFKLSSGGIIVPINHEYLAEHWLSSSAILWSWCRSLCRLHAKANLYHLLVLALNIEITGVVAIDDCTILQTKLCASSVRKCRLIRNLKITGL